MNQRPNALLVVRPASFGFNSQTAASNAFQQTPSSVESAVQALALAEFNHMLDLLESHDIDVRVFEDTAMPRKPDAVFPNNWISFHPDGTVVLYPMLAENRRWERRLDIIEALQQDYKVKEVIDFSVHEEQQRIVEGTGSLVIDYPNRIAYACRSPRTDESLVQEICARLNLKPVVFEATDEGGQAIYHTNVLMCVGEKFAVVCLDAIHQEDDQERVLNALANTGHQVIAISYDQMRKFAGNMIEVSTRQGEPVVLLSQQAFTSLVPGQLNALSRWAEPLPISIETIEKYGGGSVRCMVAANFLPRITQ